MPRKRPEKDTPSSAPGQVRVLPMQLRLGDQLTDETGNYEVIGKPYMTAGGKTANVRVKRVDSGAEMIRAYGAHERVAVSRSEQRGRE
jgi:hypothetical protein